MIKIFLAIIHVFYDYIRYKKELLTKKNLNKLLFTNLKKKLFKKSLVPKKKLSNNILVTCFVHQLGYTYLECLIAKNLSELSNSNIFGLMDENDDTANEFLNCFNSKKNYFLPKQNIISKIIYIFKSFKIIRRYNKVEQFTHHKIDNIEIGKAVYDHYIRHTGDASTNNFSYTFLILLTNSLYALNFSNKLFKEKKFNYMIMSERQFIPSSIIFQVALKYNVKIISRISGPKKFGVSLCNSSKQKNDSENKINKKFLNKFLLINKKKYSKRGLNIINKIFYGKKRNPDHQISKNINKNNQIEAKKLYKILNLDPLKKTCFIFSHNLLDGIFQGKTTIVFKDYLSWLRETLNYINKLDESINWIIKEHPSDYGFKKLTTNTKLEFDKIIGPNKKNIKFFPKNINNIVIKNVADCVITLGGTVGMEYPCFGIPSICSSGIFYSENGFTHEYHSKSKYFYYLKNITNIIDKRLSNKQIDAARVHYYLFNEITKFDHSLSYDFDVSRNLKEKEFFQKINKLIDKNYTKKDYFKYFLNEQIKNNNKFLVNKLKL